MSDATHSTKMMGSYEASYQQFGGEDSEETPQEGGVVIHVVPESGKGECLFMK